MIIPFLNNFELPDSLIEEWDNTESEDLRFVEKQAIQYLLEHTTPEIKPIGCLWTGADLILNFGYSQELEEEGFYYGS